MIKDVPRVIPILSIVFVILSNTFLLRNEFMNNMTQLVETTYPFSSSTIIITNPTATASTANNEPSSIIIVLWLITCDTRTTTGDNNITTKTKSGDAPQTQHVDLQNWLWSAKTFQQYHHNHQHSKKSSFIQVKIKNVCETLATFKCKDCNTKANSIYKFITTELLPDINDNNNIDITTTTKTDDTSMSSSPVLVTTEDIQLHEELSRSRRHYIMYTDTDTMFNSYILSPREVMERYYEVTSSLTMNHNKDNTPRAPPGGGIVFSGEPNCWVGKYCSFKEMIRMYPNTTRSSCPQFLNAGQFMGDVTTIQNMLHDIIHYTNDEFHGKLTSDQARLHQWYSTNRNTIATIDYNASIFRSLVFGLVNSSHHTTKSYAGLICGGTTKSQHKTCGMHKKPIWGKVHLQMFENESNITIPSTTTTTTTIMSDAAEVGLPYVKMDVVPTCEYAERIPFSFHGAGPNLKPHLQNMFEEFRESSSSSSVAAQQGEEEYVGEGARRKR